MRRGAYRIAAPTVEDLARASGCQLPSPQSIRLPHHGAYIRRVPRWEPAPPHRRSDHRREVQLECPALFTRLMDATWHLPRPQGPSTPGCPRSPRQRRLGCPLSGDRRLGTRLAGGSGDSAGTIRLPHRTRRSQGASCRSHRDTEPVAAHAIEAVATWQPREARVLQPNVLSFQTKLESCKLAAR